MSITLPDVAPVEPVDPGDIPAADRVCTNCDHWCPNNGRRDGHDRKRKGGTTQWRACSRCDCRMLTVKVNPGEVTR